MILKEAGKGSVEDENPGTDIKVRGILNSQRVMRVAIFPNVTPYSLVNGYQHFGGT